MLRSCVSLFKIRLQNITFTPRKLTSGGTVRDCDELRQLFSEIRAVDKGQTHLSEDGDIGRRGSPVKFCCCIEEAAVRRAFGRRSASLIAVGTTVARPSRIGKASKYRIKCIIIED